MSTRKEKDDLHGAAVFPPKKQPALPPRSMTSSAPGKEGLKDGLHGAAVFPPGTLPTPALTPAPHPDATMPLVPEAMTSRARVDMIYVVVQTPSEALLNVQRWCAAIERALREDVAPAWGLIDHRVVAVKSDVALPAVAKIVHLVDDSDVAGALGYHDDDKYPFGVVGVKQCRADNVPVEQCLCHEIFELAADAEANRCVSVDNLVTWLEICDPVEGTRGYTKNGVVLENFAYPNYFRPKAQGPYDHMGALKAPMTIAPAGYRVDASIGKHGFQQVMGDKTRASKRRMHPLSRRARRLRLIAASPVAPAPTVEPTRPSRGDAPTVDTKPARPTTRKPKGG